MRQNAFMGILAVLFWLPPAPGHGAAKQISKGIFEVGAYRFDVSAYQQSDALHLRGRVSYGPSCKKMTATFTLQNEAEIKMKMVVTIENVGGAGSPTIRGEQTLDKKKKTKSVSSQWEVIDIQVKCNP